MVKLLNRFCFHLKNIILLITLFATIFIIMYMFKRLEKDIFGANLTEFISIILPFLIFIIISIINLFHKQTNIIDNTFFNVTSLIVSLTIGIFCYRAIMDQNMVFWHKYGYKINFNYFADQLAAVKVMLYGLSLADIILIISGSINTEDKDEQKMNKTNKKKS